MPTNIMTVMFDKGIVVRESYDTIKRRLFASGDFFEATDKGGRFALNKSCVKSAAPVLQEKKIKNIQKKKEGEEVK